MDQLLQHALNALILRTYRAAGHRLTLIFRKTAIWGLVKFHRIVDERESDTA